MYRITKYIQYASSLSCKLQLIKSAVFEFIRILRAYNVKLLIYCK